MIYKEKEGVLVMFTLTTGETGLGELQSKTSDRDPCSSFVMVSAWPTWGIPSVGLSAEISFLVSLGLAWGSGEPPACGDASVFAPGRAIVVGHTQATFRLTRRRSV